VRTHQSWVRHSVAIVICLLAPPAAADTNIAESPPVSAEATHIPQCFSAEGWTRGRVAHLARNNADPAEPRTFPRGGTIAIRRDGGSAGMAKGTDTSAEFDQPSDFSEVDRYLCGVYWRMPYKIDDAGDFSWKDRAAATRTQRTVCEYAINGMHQDLREALYALGRKSAPPRSVMNPRRFTWITSSRSSRRGAMRATRQDIGQRTNHSHAKLFVILLTWTEAKTDFATAT
jgi:hypothetical protein